MRERRARRRRGRRRGASTLREEFADEILAPALEGERDVRGQVPARLGALAADHREAPRARGPTSAGPTAVAHGCTGKGNDQVRFEVSVRALAPDLEVLAPVRHWGFTREDSILYADRHDIPITATKEKLYSIDENLWGRAIECGEMEDPWAAPPPGVWAMTVPTATEPTRGRHRVRAGHARRRSTATALPFHELIAS